MMDKENRRINYTHVVKVSLGEEFAEQAALLEKYNFIFIHVPCERYKFRGAESDVRYSSFLREMVQLWGGQEVR